MGQQAGGLHSAIREPSQSAGQAGALRPQELYREVVDDLTSEKLEDMVDLFTSSKKENPKTRGDWFFLRRAVADL